MRVLFSALTMLLAAGTAFAADPANTVPEPGTLALVGAAVAAAVAFKRRGKK
jgi:hypothetical protein